MKKFIKPKDGFIVRDPLSKKPLAADGEEKEIGPYWQRRLDDGDVVPAKPAKTSNTTTSPQA